MPTMNVRYGRPKGSGRDDRQQLETIAALLAANPKLKPTTAIRSLGVEDPSAIRRLRDKFRIEQSKLMADASRPVGLPVGLNGHSNGVPQPRVGSNQNTPPAESLRPSTTPLPKFEHPPETRDTSPADAILLGWCDLGFAALATVAASQAVVAQHWLSLPPISRAVRAQLALSTVGVAVYTRSKTRPLFFH